ncbi:hypothetical protein [Haliea sp.]|jgi:hypothetical protein|uniref:hypothetical protein n=1 Tax=Haliea sp. TaxID=1932666 RepID=UPI000C391862|nr:hypothetical protein [Haliea sp.]MAD65714.1 hypothetical protein [Haliea sp.]|tara:strand:+ start:52208 stop:52546 length:339 start_codon:yes stop_codon:yes gene_type:complete
MMKSLKGLVLIGLGALLLFLVISFLGNWLASISPESISSLQSLKSVITNSTFLSYAVIILMAVFFEPIVRIFIKNKQQRELLLNSKTTIRLCVGVYIVLSEGLPIILGGSLL